MVTAQSPFVAAPRISEETFVQVLAAAGSPWAGQARELYRLIVDNGHDPGVWLAICGREHSFGTNRDSVLWRMGTNSWTNARSVRDPNITGWEIVTDPVRRSKYVWYASVEDSLRDGMYRVTDPSYVYQQGEATTIESVLRIWTEAEADAYIAYVVRKLNEWSEPVSRAKPKITLSAGHRNADGGGTSGEQAHTGPLIREIATRLRGHGGFDVRVITPDDGLGNFPGGLFDAARQVVVWSQQGWTADVFLEAHFEGNGAGNSGRGSFAIYPDWDGDMDVDVRDRLGPDLARRMVDATGIPRRGNGTMSERSTGVGSQGNRLGVFRATEPVKATTTRLIYEYGALTAPADAAIINDPDFNRQAAGATVAALGAFFDINATPQSGSHDEIIEFETGFSYSGAIAGAYRIAESVNQHWSMFGVPKSAMIDVDLGDRPVIVQRTDRGWLLHDPATGHTTRALNVEALLIDAIVDPEPMDELTLTQMWERIYDAIKQVEAA